MFDMMILRTARDFLKKLPNQGLGGHLASESSLEINSRYNVLTLDKALILLDKNDHCAYEITCARTYKNILKKLWIHISLPFFFSFSFVPLFFFSLFLFSFICIFCAQLWQHFIDMGRKWLFLRSFFFF